MHTEIETFVQRKNLWSLGYPRQIDRQTVRRDGKPTKAPLSLEVLMTAIKRFADTSRQLVGTRTNGQTNINVPKVPPGKLFELRANVPPRLPSMAETEFLGTLTRQ